jgi:hypothetical protein
MMNKQKAKKKDIEELIWLITLQNEQLEPNISMFVQQTLSYLGRNTNIQKVMSKVTQRIRNDIERLLVPFDEIFTHDEIMLLISFYREVKRLIWFFESDAMKKFSKNGRRLFDPIYESFRLSLAEGITGIGQPSRQIQLNSTYSN